MSFRLTLQLQFVQQYLPLPGFSPMLYAMRAPLRKRVVGNWRSRYQLVDRDVYFSAADLAAVLATCHLPRRRGRGVESDQVAAARGRLDAVIAGLRCHPQGRSAAEDGPAVDTGREWRLSGASDVIRTRI